TGTHCRKCEQQSPTPPTGESNRAPRRSVPAPVLPRAGDPLGHTRLHGRRQTAPPQGISSGHDATRVAQGGGGGTPPPPPYATRNVSCTRPSTLDRVSVSPTSESRPTRGSACRYASSCSMIPGPEQNLCVKPRPSMCRPSPSRV